MEKQFDRTLFAAIRNKKYEEILHLVEGGASINALDENTGRQPLHLAAYGGSTEIVTILVDNGADVNCKDQNDYTPLHIATMCGHENVVVLLLALGTELEAKNKEGHTALYCAVMDKNPQLVEMLLRFGTDPCVTEWHWTSKNIDFKELQILQAFDGQCQFIPGFKNGFICKKLFYIKPMMPCYSEQLQMEIVTSSVTSPFVVLCYKMQLEYAHVRHRMNRREHYMSDVYELRTWNCFEEEVELLVTINGHIKSNRILKLITIGDCNGRIEETFSSFIDKDNLQKTKVHLCIRIRDGRYQKFIISSEERSEIFQVTTHGTKLNPDIMPSGKITLPNDFVSSNVILSLKVIDTVDINKDAEKCICVTDILSINTLIDIQPDNDISISIPVHTTTDHHGVVVLAFKNCSSNLIEDWEIVEPLKNTNMESVMFNTKRLSLFVGVSRSFALKERGLFEIKSALQRVIANEKMIQFLILSKKAPDNEGDLSVVVQCVLSTKTRSAQELWKRRGYKLLNISAPLICAVNSVFQIALFGNIEEVFHSMKLELEFHLFRDNYRVFNVCARNKDEKAEGDIKIQLSKLRSTVEIVGENGSDCLACGVGVKRHRTIEAEEYKTLFSCSLSFDHKECDVPLSKIFDGFRLMWAGRSNKVAPLG